jgi:hypothetical protein
MTPADDQGRTGDIARIREDLSAEPLRESGHRKWQRKRKIARLDSEPAIFRGFF